MIEFIITILFSIPVGLSGGERDAELIKCPPAETTYYQEWAYPESLNNLDPGNPYADPEMKQLFVDIDNSVMVAAEKLRIEEGDEVGDQVENIYDLLKTLSRTRGCMYVYFNPEIQPSEVSGIENAPKELRGAIIINFGKDADKIEPKIVNILKFAKESARDERFDDFFPEDLNNLILPKFAPVDFIMHKQGNYVIVAYGKDALEHAKKGLSGKAQGFETTEFAKKSVANQPKNFCSTVNVDVQILLKNIVKIAPEESLMLNSGMALLGLNGLKSFTSETYLENHDVVTKCEVVTSGRTDGIMALLAGDGITQKSLSHLPGDTEMAIAFSLDIEKVMSSVRTMVAAADAGALENMESGIKEIENVMGISIEDDLIPALGDDVVLWNATSQGGLLLAHPILSIDLKKADVVEGAFTKLCKAIDGLVSQGESRPPFYLKERKFLDHKILYFQTMDEDLAVSVSFCFHENHLLVALTPQALKSYLRMDKAKIGPPEQLNAFLGDDTENPTISFSYVDITKSSHFYYTIMNYGLTSISGDMQRDIHREFGADSRAKFADSFSIPSNKFFEKHCRPGYLKVKRTKTGFTTEQKMAPVLQYVGLVPGVMISIFGAF